MISFAITVGITRLMIGKITLFNVAILPACDAPAVALSVSAIFVFSKTDDITSRLLPSRPSRSVSRVVSQFFPSKRFSIFFSCFWLII